MADEPTPNPEDEFRRMLGRFLGADGQIDPEKLAGAAGLPQDPEMVRQLLAQLQGALSSTGDGVDWKVAREGARLTNAFHTTPLCSPNRACILTGQYASRHGIIDNVGRDAASHRLPAIYFERQFVTVGGLMSLGPNFADQFRQAAGYVDRILKGAKPAELPIEQPTRFELVINAATARTLGLRIPAALRLRADVVLE